jgi:hypothetical protein
MDLGHGRCELIDQLRRRRLREECRDHRAHELVGRQVDLSQVLLKALFENIGGREPAHPA